MRTQVGIVGAGPAGLTLAQLLRARGDRVGRARGRAAATTSSTASGPACSSRARSTCCAGAGVGERHGPRRHRPPRDRAPVRRGAPPHPAERAHRRAGDPHLRPDRDRQGPDPAGSTRGAPLLFEVERRRRARHRRRPAPDHASGTRAAAQELECDLVAGCDGFHGVCRRASRPACLREFSREYPYGWLGILADVAPSNDELIYSHTERGSRSSACARRRSAASTSSAAPTRISASGPTSGSGTSSSAALGARRLDARRGPDPREGRHGDAQLRRRADAARPPVPRRRRRPHRPADRRQGPEPRHLGRDAARRGDRRLAPRRGARPRCSTPTPTPACGGSGGPSTSRGG